MNLINRSIRSAAVLGLLVGTVAGCKGDGADGSNPDCQGGKCDTPGGTPSEQCESRQAEVLSSTQRGFTPDAIRWACADVEGVNTVNRDDRGQEYCEYFAIFQPPGQEGDTREAIDLGRPKSGSPGDVTPLRVCVGDEKSADCGITITEDQLFDMEDNPTEVVGACVFTSWHSDVPGPLPACEGGTCGDDAQVFGFPFTDEFFRMKISFNSNGAAEDLVGKCLNKGLNGETPMPEDWENPDDPLTEPFFRGCLAVQDLFGTGWRRSDPSICAVMNRLAECGCGVPGVPTDQLARAVIPRQPEADGSISLRGFRLGTWDDELGLPPGCRYANTGDQSRTLVLCDLSATDVKDNLNDPKEACRALYGPQVVVHVPVPAAAIECNPPDTAAAATCGQIPWNIGQEGTVVGEDTGGESGGGESGGDGPGTCCEERTEKGCSNETIQACVCADDSFCCNSRWDNICKTKVDSLGCGTCDPGGDEGGSTGGSDGGSTGGGEPPGGTCCEVQTTPGCSDAEIQQCVCAQDSFCCNSSWDNVCVGEVGSFGCSGVCSAAN